MILSAEYSVTFPSAEVTSIFLLGFTFPKPSITSNAALGNLSNSASNVAADIFRKIKNAKNNQFFREI